MKYSFNTRVRYSEIGVDGRLTPGALIDYFQDTATFQSEDYGIGLDYMRPFHYAWILASWQIDMLRMPSLGEEVVSTTWAYGFEKFYGYRNFTLTGEDGELLARANSVWVLMNMEKQRPVKVDPLMLEKYGTEAKIEMEYAPRHILLPEGGEGQPPIVIESFHLDTNRHVNNARYVELALGCLPEAFEFSRMRVEYKKQALLGDVLIPVISRSSEAVTVTLSDEEKTPYCIVELS